jgi:hypothetical protein
MNLNNDFEHAKYKNDWMMISNAQNEKMNKKWFENNTHVMTMSETRALLLVAFALHLSRDIFLLCK